MNRSAGGVLGIGIGVLSALPAPVLAVTGRGVDPLQTVVSAVGLGLAILLLVEALQVRRLATGGAIAQRISMVILATMCLATSALIEWVVVLLPKEITTDQASFAARLLVIAAMGLLAAYFFGVRVAMQRFLDSMTGSELLDAVDPPESAESAEPKAADAAPTTEAESESPRG
ncbi:MAG: hypothetical protein HY876_10835 [Coriobacteriales bacterium]|nr:hypothetical protein [Coriobacteriales bacterium]